MPSVPDPAIGQEAHRSRAKRVQFVVSKGGGVSECLRRRHAIRDQVDDVQD